MFVSCHSLEFGENNSVVVIELGMSGEEVGSERLGGEGCRQLAEDRRRGPVSAHAGLTTSPAGRSGSDRFGTCVFGP